ncbi:uncharacterized protein LOC114945558 [Nylanderia fulva]|uniref:uncharacterized protein LOC114945558 n=1 Tax=Nylanderia fulva TaxID=613905 RepID=UPI0010FBB665|nr:uncharacterized protein LOC114945558 [Nylanderia fulva]
MQELNLRISQMHIMRFKLKNLIRRPKHENVGYNDSKVPSRVLCDRLDPDDPYAKSFEELCNKLGEYYAPEPLEIAEIYTFRKRMQKEGEAAQEYIAALQKLSLYCKFDNYLNTELRNQFVFGIKNPRIQARLLETIDLTKERALKIACAMEMADQGVNKLKDESAVAVDFVGAGSKNKKKSKEKDRRKQPFGKAESKKTAHNAEIVWWKPFSAFLLSSSEYEMFGMRRLRPLEKSMQEERPNRLCRYRHNRQRARTFKVKDVDTWKYLNMYVIEYNRQPLLGREWINQLTSFNKFKESLEEVQSLHLVEQSCNDRLKNLLEKYANVTSENFEPIKKIKAQLNLKPNSQPVFLRSRQVPFQIKNKVENELNRMVEAGILKPVEASTWATPIVPVLKKDGGVRICGDFSVTVNSCLIVDEHTLPTHEELFAKMAGYITVFLDDIKIASVNVEKHFEILELVLSRLSEYNIRINLEKCTFLKNQISYCGHIIGKDGIKKEKKKMEAVEKLPRPKNVSEVRAFIGLINYYGRFIENMSDMLKPLNDLLKKNSHFKWTSACERAFNSTKQAFCNDKILVSFNPNLPIVLATDASPYGVGAVLSHVYLNGTERKLTGVQCNADAALRGFPPGFDFDIKFRKTENHGNADGFSRLPIKENNRAKYDVLDVYTVDTLNMQPVKASEIQTETRKDENLLKIVEALEQELHLGHIGIVRMKALARNYVWWQGIDLEIEKTVRSCKECSRVQNNPKPAPLHHWEPTEEAFQRIHMDFAGLFAGYNFLVCVDAHTKWPEVYIDSSLLPGYQWCSGKIRTNIETMVA